MALSLVSAPEVEPVSIDEARAHLRVEHHDEDGLIAGLIAAARQYAEAYTGRALVTQTWDWKLDAFPCEAFVVPLSPVASVTSISYVDTSGATQTWGSSNYLTDLPSGPMPARARVTSAYGVSYPSTRDVVNAVTLRFVAGYGDAEDVPDGIRAAMKLLIGHWHAKREPVIAESGVTVQAVPMTVDALLWPFKCF